MTILASQGTYIEFKGLFFLKVRKFAKMTFLGAGFIRLAPHPKGPPNGVDYAFASSEPTSSWPQTQHILFQKKRPNGRYF
jgi:hypothetical protein